jgi:hypothetical protein
MKREARMKRLRRQVAWLDDRLARLGARSARLTWARVWTFLGGSLLTLAIFLVGGAWAGVGAGALASLLFGAVVAVHRQMEAGIARHAVWRDLRREQLARLELDWAALPPPAGGRPPADHPFGRDLDLAGPRSVLHRIDRCATRDGSQRLRAWLLQPMPDLDAARHRQALLQALVRRDRLRDRLLLEARLAALEAQRRWSERGEVGEDGRWSVDASLAWLLEGGDEEGHDAVGDAVGESPAEDARAARPAAQEPPTAEHAAAGRGRAAF